MTGVSAMETVVVRHSGPRAFLDRAESWLLQREAEHNLILWVAGSLARGGLRHFASAYFATVERGGEVVGCAFRTPPYKIALTQMPPPGPRLLARDAAEVYESLPAALGPVEEVVAFGEAWADLRGVAAVPGGRQRIHVLKRVRFPAPAAPGVVRMAGPADLPLVTRWMEAFIAETGDHHRSPAEVAERLMAGDGRDGRLALWENVEPVSMAGLSGRTRHGVRIGYVYTPREHRRRGYASVLVAALSEQVLDSGFAHCALFTDLANPTANRIYHAIGYRPVQDVMDVLFE